MKDMFDSIVATLKSAGSGFWGFVFALFVVHSVLSGLHGLLWLFGRGLGLIFMVAIISLQVLFMVSFILFINDKVSNGKAFASFSEVMTGCAQYIKSLWDEYGDDIKRGVASVCAIIGAIVSQFVAFIMALFAGNRLPNDK